MANLKELRNKKGLTQQDLADKLAVSENTIQNWENGKTVPKGDNLRNYLDALGIDDPTERQKLVAEISGVACSAESGAIDNIPYCLFAENSDELARIKNCFASAEELDMLGIRLLYTVGWKIYEY